MDHRPRALPRRAAALAVAVLLGPVLVGPREGGPVAAAAAAPVTGVAADRVLTSEDAFPNGFTVPAGKTWVFDPARSVSLQVGGNVVVHGRLEMKPSARSVKHTLTFTGIDEDEFVGASGVVSHAPTKAVAGDVGLWVLGSGVLDVRGTARTAWAYSYQSSWKGDEVRRAPIAKGDYSSFPVVTATPKPNAMGYKAELLNLTRNVVIQGEPNGRTHILIRSTEPQSIRYATIRHVAPDIPARGQVTGRYGLHFHMMHGASAGSLVEGVVIRDATNHAFVPHASNGIAFRNTIAYDTTGEAYWWDESTDGVCGEVVDCHASHNIVYDGVVAALTRNSPYAKHTTAAIQLGAGRNNTIVNSVAVGMQGGGNNNAGYIWPSQDHGVWTFRNNVAHNNSANGVFVWQNTGSLHVVDRLTAYHNKKAGVDHGAYHNPYFFRDAALRGNGVAIESHALGKHASGTNKTQRWTNVYTGGTGLLTPQPHNNFGDQTTPVRFTYCDFSKVVFAELGANGKPKSEASPGRYDFVECNLKTSDFVLSGAANGTVIRVQDGGAAYRLTGAGVKTAISKFASVALPAPPPPPPPQQKVSPPGGTSPNPPPAGPPPPEPPRPDGGAFGDVAGSVFAADIAWLAATGITKGCNPPANTRFCPGDPVTRGQMAAFLTRALDLPPGKERFTDDEGSVFEANINALALAGVTKGCNPPANTRFCPGDPVTRGQMAAFLVRAFDLPPATGGFHDDDGSIFERDIGALAGTGITLGCNPPANTRFCPGDPVTRGQMAAFLHRAERFLPGRS